uniref:Unannotated protein n=1 Tax=freshwater metagenome TaxID=449393 RepID=A0A6J5ZCP2_9ZZZZ
MPSLLAVGNARMALVKMSLEVVKVSLPTTMDPAPTSWVPEMSITWVAEPEAVEVIVAVSVAARLRSSLPRSKSREIVSEVVTVSMTNGRVSWRVVLLYDTAPLPKGVAALSAAIQSCSVDSAWRTSCTT